MTAHPYSAEQTAELWRLWRIARDEGLQPASPFVACRGSVFTSARHRVLIVGQAPYGFGPVEPYAEASIIEAVARDEILEGTEPFRPRSAFWKFFDAIARKPRSATWSNLAKIGGASANPGIRLFALQKRLCAELLVTELVHLAPDVAVFLTGNMYAEIIENVVAPLDSPKWERTKDAWMTRWSHSGQATEVVWTFHPSRKSAERRQCVLDVIAARMPRT